MSDCVQLVRSDPSIFTVGLSHVLRACHKAGMTDERTIAYPEIQEAYVDLFNRKLGSEELKRYFNCKHAKIVFVKWLHPYFVIPREKTDDSTIYLRLRHSWSVVKNMITNDLHVWDSLTPVEDVNH
ncbi:hypothetical protein FO519_003165 [Halicephalobus sp. NKZ332]|nr:hypothetical protein FO519_003165 [Halicephalobus sp. NKZ332]